MVAGRRDRADHDTGPEPPTERSRPVSLAGSETNYADTGTGARPLVRERSRRTGRSRGPVRVGLGRTFQGGRGTQRRRGETMANRHRSNVATVGSTKPMVLSQSTA